MVRESRRYLGLDLAGAKNNKTAIAVLEYYPKEGKTFLLDIHDRIPEEKAPDVPQAASQKGNFTSGDAALLALLEELRTGVSLIGVNVPLELPPCITCTRKSCRDNDQCAGPAVQWMKEISRKATRAHVKVLEFTPYTQRPVELWVRYQILPKLHPYERFEIDETLGGNRAPLTARMHFIQKHLSGLHLVEVWPKLSIALLAREIGLSKRTVMAYRQLEEGIQAREEILEHLADRADVFIYERDIRKLAHNLPAFDAFFCAYTALLRGLDRTAEIPAGFPDSGGWVHYPKLEHR